MAYLDRKGLRVDAELAEFLENEALPGTDVSADAFWDGLARMAAELGPKTRALLEKRETLQTQIDDWHKAHRGQAFDAAAYKAFLEEIGYLVPEGPDFEIETANTDPEFASLPGPQLVVPIMNARYALNAANARWGSLYDALYGTDALGTTPLAGGYDKERGAQVIGWAKAHLDAVVPLETGSWADVHILASEGGQLHVNDGISLADPSQYAGYAGIPSAPDGILLKANGLHIWLKIDKNTPVGAQDPAGISDIVLESAISSIMDCEDSVAAVDGPDKTLAYRNWLGLMRGDLREEVSKGGKSFTRELAHDLTFHAPDRTPLTLKGRALMLVRNVG
ncbi:MAG: malate synthase G, partial [Mangrovicoccus sp.]